MTRPIRNAAALSAVLLAGCGQTGPLYLPDTGIETPVEIRGPAPSPETPPAVPPEPPPQPEGKNEPPGR